MKHSLIAALALVIFPLCATGQVWLGLEAAF
jgi:hypothetical protein